MEETKRCPYCGEKILTVAKKCKHCGEWLDRPEKISFVRNRKDTNDMLFCKVCKAEISPDTKNCPQCGADDPILMKTKKISWKEIILAFIIIPTTVFAISLPFGVEDSFQWRIGSYIASVVIYLLWLTIKVIAISKENNRREEFYRNFLQSLGKEDKIIIWKKYRNR